MIELRTGASVQSLLQQLSDLRTPIRNSTTAYNLESALSYFLQGVETSDRVFRHSLDDGSWYEWLYSPGYWAVRDVTPTTPRAMPLVESEANRLLRWFDEIETELKRMSTQDEWDDDRIPRLVFDTSALVREGQFDIYDWSKITGGPQARLIIPILVVRELDNLKNFGKLDKARPRLRRIFEILHNAGRGPAPIRDGTTLELLMDPPRHRPLPVHDEEIVRRAAYLRDRKGGPVVVITGDYTMLARAGAEGLRVEMTPAELAVPNP